MICQHTSSFVIIGQHTHPTKSSRLYLSLSYVSIRHTSAHVRICQHTSAYVSIRQHTSAYTPE